MLVAVSIEIWTDAEDAERWTPAIATDVMESLERLGYGLHVSTGIGWSPDYPSWGAMETAAEFYVLTDGENPDVAEGPQTADLEWLRLRCTADEERLGFDGRYFVASEAVEQLTMAIERHIRRQAAGVVPTGIALVGSKLERLIGAIVDLSESHATLAEVVESQRRVIEDQDHAVRWLQKDKVDLTYEVDRLREELRAVQRLLELEASGGGTNLHLVQGTASTLQNWFMTAATVGTFVVAVLNYASDLSNTCEELIVQLAEQQIDGG